MLIDHFKKHLALALCASLLASACQSQEDKDRLAQAQRQARAASPEVQAQVQALLTQTRKQMQPIAGGSFWLGDFGVLMPSDGEGKFDVHPRPGPELPQDLDNLPFTIDTDNKPPRWVTLSSYALGSHKVTYADFDVYVAAQALPPHPPTVLDEDSEEEGYKRRWRNARTSDDVPAGVTWGQAKGYCQWLAQTSGLPYDLPTEAQWEYAASNRQNNARRPHTTRSGKIQEGVTHPSFEEEKRMLGRRGRLYPVARFEPSPDGLYDLVGNGLDWVNDWYAPGYSAGPAVDPQGPDSGTEKVLRGMPKESMVDYRYLKRFHKKPESLEGSRRLEDPFAIEGFRCALNTAQPANPKGGQPPVTPTLKP
jgi:sulfatase modifying factor 1